jgi:hypothetical protein
MDVDKIKAKGEVGKTIFYHCTTMYRQLRHQKENFKESERRFLLFVNVSHNLRTTCRHLYNLDFFEIREEAAKKFVEASIQQFEFVEELLTLGNFNIIAQFKYANRDENKSRIQVLLPAWRRNQQPMPKAHENRKSDGFLNIITEIPQITEEKQEKAKQITFLLRKEDIDSEYVKFRDRSNKGSSSSSRNYDSDFSNKGRRRGRGSRRGKGESRGRGRSRATGRGGQQIAEREEKQGETNKFR